MSLKQPSARWALTDLRGSADGSGRAALPPAAPFLCGLLGVDREGRLDRRHREAAVDALLQTRHQDVVAEVLPAFLGVVNCDDRPPLGRRTGGVEDLAGGKSVGRGGGRRRPLVLLHRPPGELMHNAVSHSLLLSWGPTPFHLVNQRRL